MIKSFLLFFFFIIEIEGRSQMLITDSVTLIVTINDKYADTATIRKAFEKVSSRIHCSDKNASIKSLDRQLQLKISASSDTQLLRYLILSKGSFRIVETFDNFEIYPSFEKVNEVIVKNSYYVDTSKTATSITRQYPLFALLVPATTEKGSLKIGACVGYAKTNDTARLMQLLHLPDIQASLPTDVRFYWTKQDIKGWYSLIATKEQQNRASMTNSTINIVKITQSETNKKLEVFIYFKKEFHQTWADMTCDNISKSLAIMIDNKVYSYPVVQNEIRTGGAVIIGNWKREELEAITCILKYPYDVELDIK
jgi:hypothetical protein